MKISMISTGDKVTCMATVWDQLGVCEHEHVCMFFHKPVRHTGTKLKIPALDSCKPDRWVRKVSACKKYLWNVCHLPGTILDTWVAVVNKTGKVGTFNKLLCQWRRKRRSQ